MDAAPSTRGDSHRTQGAGHNPVFRIPRPALGRPERTPLPRQLPVAIVWGLVANAPSRADMRRPYPRADLRENLSRLYDALWRHAHATHSATLATTWDQLATACGYEAESGTNRHGTLFRWVELMEEVGLVRVRGERDELGAWRRLRVQLLEPDPAAVAAIEVELWGKRATGLEPATCSLEGCRSTNGASRVRVPSRHVQRRRETRRERHERRHRPYRRKAGRGVTEPRWSLRSRSKVPSPFGAPGGSALKGLPPGAMEEKGETRARVGEAAGRSGRARASWAGSEEGGAQALAGSDVRRGVPEQRAAVLELEQRFFRAVQAAVPGVELEPLRDTRRLEYALSRLDRWAWRPGHAIGRPGAGLEFATRIVEALAADLAAGDIPPGGMPRHVGVVWPELHREGFSWRRTARHHAGRTDPSRTAAAASNRDGLRRPSGHSVSGPGHAADVPSAAGAEGAP